MKKYLSDKLLDHFDACPKEAPKKEPRLSEIIDAAAFAIALTIVMFCMVAL